MSIITAVISAGLLLTGAKNSAVAGIEELSKEEGNTMDKVKGTANIAMSVAFLYGAKIVIETLKSQDS